jgi:hypothetical protein
VVNISVNKKPGHIKHGISVRYKGYTNPFGMKFRFKTIHALKLQVFQVYTELEGKKIRFYMQRNKEDAFYITDKEACPAVYYPLEKELSNKVLTSQEG